MFFAYFCCNMAYVTILYDCIYIYMRTRSIENHIFR